MNSIKLSEIAKKHNLLVLVLFGSRAKKTNKKNSDYDFAFYAKKELSSEKYLNLFEDIMKELKDEKIDLIDVNKNKSHLLRYQIFSTGKCLYEFTKGFFNELKYRAWFDYKDFECYYDKQNEIVKRKLGII